MKQPLLLLIIVLSLNISSFSQTHKVLESTSESIKIEFNFESAYQVEENIINGRKVNKIDGNGLNLRIPGEPSLPKFNFNIGVPFNANPVIKIINPLQEKISNVYILPEPDSLNQPFEILPYNFDIYNSNKNYPASSAEIGEDFIMRYARIISLNISPYQFNPVSRELIFHKKFTVQIDFNSDQLSKKVISKIYDKMTDDLLKSTVINYDKATEFTGKLTSDSDSRILGETYWYNSQKDYYKFYLNKKGVYRITYEMLVNSGVPASGLQNNTLELFNNGVSIPIDVVDANDDGIFNSGDYFQFVGEPAKPANQFTRMNIYNLTNVYWFSYQADSINYYKYINGNSPSSSPLITSTVKSLRWEDDNLYQQLGHARNDQRDYWFMGYAEARNRSPFRDFVFWIEDTIAQNHVTDKPQAKLKVGLHGLTTTSCTAQNGHSATIKFNGKTLGVEQWNFQESALFEKDFYVAVNSSFTGDTAQIFTNRQKFEMILFGNICPNAESDFVLVNYIEFDYWRWNRTNPNYFYFTSPPDDFGENRYYVWRWMRDNMKVYIPSRGELMANPNILHSSDNAVVFTDIIESQTDYYCVADDYFMTPDSIVHNDNSDLRNTANGADYIIITHPLFQGAAQRLADYRASNLSGYETPRIRVVNINDVYNEFSFGLLDPYALQNFAKYAFESWQSPAPSYIVLLGDMSHDYRSIYLSSRKNFIPSIPFHGTEFGQLPSDNSIVLVAGNDRFPDISIGRLSCETLSEANTLVDKIISYPSDNSKQWKQNVILLASGLSEQDQISLQFNARSDTLEKRYFIPNGLSTTKVYNYPEPHQIEFKGDGPRMREEINKGAAIVNYYGHGGGGQWDLIFTKDDIYELRNEGRLPFISSVTCYTAHFSNAESFGEVFTKVPDKGAIGFWGSVSLTWWPPGHFMNMKLYENIFDHKNYVIGKAILSTLASGISNSMIPQVAYLGDPAVELAIPKYPDFEIKSSDITISPPNPLKEDTVLVSINIKNLGITFPDDSVTVELYKSNPDISNFIGEVKLPSFGENAVAEIKWIPGEAGLYNLLVRVNEKNIIDEVDHSDNIASGDFSVYDFGEPNVIKPVNGYFTNSDKIDFLLADIGIYFDRNFNYYIEINTSPEFNGSSLVKSPSLNPVDGIVKWQSQSLAAGEYFWRAVIYDAADTNYSHVKIFTITEESSSGYLAQNKQLQLFDLNNINFSEDLNSLVLNTELSPPHPEEGFFLDSIYISLPSDLAEPSTFTTDGAYFYYAHLPHFNNGARSKIYKVGTGLNGTVAGQNYGAISDLQFNIYSSLMYHSGYLYTCTGSLNRLLRINTQTGDTATIFLRDNLLLTLAAGNNQIGGIYLYSDGEFVYNLATGTSTYPSKFVLRKFDPSTWSKIGEDLILSGSTIRSVMSFFIVDNYLILYETYFHRYLRRYNLTDGVFEEEWTYSSKVLDYYSITYDKANNLVFFSTFRPGDVDYTPAFIKYSGSFADARGEITSQEIGPGSKWHDLEFEIDQTNSQGRYTANLLGKNISSGVWEVLETLKEKTVSLEDIDARKYNLLKLNFLLVDSSFGIGEPLKFKSLKVNYDYVPEISMMPKDISFSTDSMLQGIDVNLNIKVYNYGYIPVDSVKLDFYLNDGDASFQTRYISVQTDSFTIIDQTIKTDTIIFETKIKIIASTPFTEYFTFNNLIEKSFYVARDSIKPAFKITFDGKEIIDGDIVSSQPEVIITLKDNSPLPLDQSLFTIVYDNELLNFTPDTLIFETVSPYPNSEARVVWTPNITVDGGHTLQVLAKDASGNFIDSTYSVLFNVFNQSDLRDVYNYPNPFKNNTSFTFELRGVNVPEELYIKIYTIAGRMIQELNIPPSILRIGFNKIHWNGRDRDGDEIANGLYFYKVVYKSKDVVKSITQKLAKVN